jgi:phosphatidylglycerophosphate synthase
LRLVPPPSPLKSHDSIVAVLFAGRVARWLIPSARQAGLSPNQITMSSLAVTLLAAIFIAFGQQTAWVVAALLVQVAFILDCLDGQLARSTGNVTETGRYLDSLTDLVKVFTLISAMTVALLRHREGTLVCALGAAAFFGFVLCEEHLQLVRQLPPRPQEETEQASWKAKLRFGGQTIDPTFAIGEVLTTITLSLLLGRVRAGLLVLMIVMPIQFALHARGFWKQRDAR